MKSTKPKLPPTPHYLIVRGLRQLWLRSRERVAALKRDKYTCQDCGGKQSVAKGREFKVEVDHLDENIDWDKIVEYVRRHLLVPPERLETVCKPCHQKRTEMRKRIENPEQGSLL